MIPECPGAKFFKQPEPEFIKCPYCSGEVEIWTDEVKAVCPKCKNSVMRQQRQSCLDWCKYAKECVGDEVFNKYLQNKSLIKESKIPKKAKSRR